MINEFRGNYRWLSNFWLSPVMLGKHVFPSVENAYQASKFDAYGRIPFLTCSPGAAKEMGQKVKLPGNWDSEKLRVMNILLEQKFRYGTWNAELLLRTGDQEIIEGNCWGDTFWGVCDGEGKNILGMMLMNIRDKLKEDQAND